MRIDPQSRRTYEVLVPLAGATLLCILGWRLFWFLADDAFILFRYVSNAHLGFGYVWNAPPFKPVEGYSCFLWVALLDLVWRVFGVAPPQSTNVLSLFLTLATLGLGAVMVLRVTLPSPLERHRPLILGLALLWITTNRTFLAWSSSGLETALFNLLLTGWVCAGLFPAKPGLRRDLPIAMLAAALALTRPDGLLFVVATIAILILHSRERWRILSFAPLLTVPVHLIWRRIFYGDWLPNTYYAKYSSPWPESGIRYAASFILEYAVWFWLAVAAWSLVPRLRSRSRIDVKSIVIATLLAHLGYYTFIIGGDHFEYRVYSHLTLLLPVAFVWLLGARPLRPRAAILLMSTAWLLSLPVPWTHWGLARNLTTREATIQMRVEVAPHWPVPFRFYAEGFDRLQDWLIRHMVCVRHQEHSVFWRESIKLYPSREEGARISSEEFPIHADFAVGVPGWTLPHVYILDLWGLNDRVVARSRLPAKGARYMAHERVAPRDYLDCLRPNVVLSPEGRWVVRPRQRVLTAADIRRCENR